ncbi:MAG: DMT family transporter [Acidobacteria bacterium]|nr:DMT family transporter [Acidobacteriota bacterium]
MNRSAPAPGWHADLALVGIALIWGATFVIVKQALDSASTLVFLALRFAIATLALAFAFRGRYGRLSERRRELRGGVLAGICLFAGFAFQTFGLRHTTPSKSAFITGLSIVMVPLIGSLVYRKAPQVSEALGIAAATVGMALMTLEGPSLAIAFGDLLTLACAVAFALHILVVGGFSAGGSFEALSLTQIATAALLAVSVCGWAEPPRAVWTAGLLAALVVTGLLATALAFSVQAWAQQRTTPTRTALIFALEPVFAWITSYLVYGELLAARAAGGAGLILAGILLVELKPIARGKHP